MLISFSLQATPSKKSITINFEINDQIIQGKDIQILYSKIHSQWFNPPNSDDYIVHSIGNKITLEITKNITPIGYLWFNFSPYYIYNKQIIGFPLLCEAGDEINIKLEDGEISFTGNGANKFINQLSANRIEYQFAAMAGLGTYKWLKQRQLELEIIYNQRLNVINGLRPFITASVYNQLNFNYILNNKYNLLSLIISSWRTGDALSRNDASNFFNSYVKSEKIDSVVDQEMMLNSNNYLEFCDLLERCKIYVHGNKAEFTKENPFQQFYNNIKLKYKGVVRDRLVAKSLDHCPNDSLQIYLNDALKIVNDQFSLQQLTRMKRGMKGMAAYNFSLPDSTGKPVKLSDLKGKVVMIDIWFTGCHWCGVLNRDMAPVYKVFKDNPEVVFLSVCLDKSKEMFVKSVNSGIYTDSGSLNVYTNGQGENHELMKFYGFQGAPHQMLIDKNGKLWKGDDFKISTKDQSAYQEVIDEINAALNAK